MGPDRSARTGRRAYAPRRQRRIARATPPSWLDLVMKSAARLTPSGALAMATLTPAVLNRARSFSESPQAMLADRGTFMSSMRRDSPLPLSTPARLNSQLWLPPQT